LAADHAEITRLGLRGPREHAHVVAVAAGDNQKIRGGIRLYLGEGVLIAGVDLARHGEALAVGELLAIVDHTDGETGGMRRVRDGYGDEPAAEDIQHRLRQDGLNEYFERAAADQPIVVARF